VPIRVRPIHPSDAEAYVELLAWLDNESRYPVVNVLERSMTAAEWRSALELLHDRGQRMILVAEEVDEDVSPGDRLETLDVGPPHRLVGFLSTTSDWFGGVHELRIVIGIREAYTGQGIGTRLFTGIEAWARKAGVGRLHLTVEADNARALALYHKMGFTIEGHIARAVQIQGQWVDDYVMAKWLRDVRG
jgi:RimJ/RimL family protein N-acetyltransferase